MSAEGGAAIIVVPVGLILAPAVLAAALAAGAVIVVAGSAMWVGQQLHARYVDSCASWGEAERNLIAQSRGKIIPMEELLAGPLADFMRRAAAQPENDGSMSPIQQQALAAELQRAMAAAQSADTTLAIVPELSPEQRELERARGDLALEVYVARQQGIAADIVDAAESARTGDLAQVTAALDRLRLAWANVHETQRIQAKQREAATIRLALVRGTIAGLREQERNGALAVTLDQSVRLGQIEHEVGVAQGRLADSPERARIDVEALQSQLDELERAIMLSMSRAGAAGVSGARAEVAQLKGRLVALSLLVREAEIYHYAPSGTWQKRINTIEASLKDANAVTVDMSALARDIEQIEREAFACIDGGQQRALAGQIAEVLNERGFHQDALGLKAVEIEDFGDGAHRVVGVRNNAQPDLERDDKMVTFTLEANGRLKYDFSGYVGDECHADMQAIFEGLRKRGIIIADEGWQPPSGVLLTYDQAQTIPGPHIVTNKEQALIASAVIAAFHHMGISDDEITVTSIGAQIHLNASKEGLGYYDFGVNARGEVTDADYTGEKPRAEALEPVLQAIGTQQQHADHELPVAESDAKRAEKERLRKRNQGFIRSGNAIQQ